MATQADSKEIDLQAQLAKIRRNIAEINRREVETRFESRKFYLSAIATAAGLLAAGATIGGVAVKFLGG